MVLQVQISQQRVRHIVQSYHLDGGEGSFFTYLEELMLHYPLPLIELSLVEILVESWLTVPFAKGEAFLDQVHGRLQQWEQQPIVSSLTADQFRTITGLDPTPVFGDHGSPRQV
ncbi:MAG: hypothetical protein AAF289_11840 [Cyanobacteria bacterium P01_A01_bin.135]